MSDGGGVSRKRARFFGRDPLPGIVFSLDTSREELPAHLFGRKRSCVSIVAAVAAATTAAAAAAGRISTSDERPPSVEGSPYQGTTVSNGQDIARSTIPSPAKAADVGGGSNQFLGAVLETNTSDNPLTKRDDHAAIPSKVSNSSVLSHGSTSRSDTAEGPSSSAVTHLGVHRAASTAFAASPDYDATAATVSHAARDDEISATATVSLAEAALVAPIAVDQGKQHPHLDAQIEAGEGVRLVTKTTTTMKQQPTSQQPAQLSAAASMVASFLKQGSALSLLPPRPAPPPSTSTSPSSSTLPSPPARRHASPRWSSSPPTTPTSLTALVTGVPPGSGGGVTAGMGSLQSDSGSIRAVSSPLEGEGERRGSRGCGGERMGVGYDVPSPRRVSGGSRFFNDEWPQRLKERRRIVRFPKRSEPAGKRILYWVRGNYRVRDNLALSVAMWLSTQLRMPLQAMTFVDPVFGTSSHTRSKSDGQRHAAPGTPYAIPYRAAVEVSALCEMEQSLRALHVPLLAIACAEGDIPSALARWCGSANGQASKSAAEGTTPDASTPATVSPGSSAAVSATGLPLEGNVHVAITDEQYHPRQLLLLERAKEALPGVALYGVDSSCVRPVNTYRGGRAVSATGKRNVDASSAKDFRLAQDALLSIVCGELTPRPRLPLDVELQRTVLGDRIKTVPQGFEDVTTLRGPANIAVVGWEELREISVRRFPELGRPFLLSSGKDLMASFGGGERVGEAALRQILKTVSTSPPEKPINGTLGDNDNDGGDGVPRQVLSSSLESEVEGTGFGGSLLHLLRLGSISGLRVVQAVFDSARSSRAEEGKDEVMPKTLTRLLDAVLSREYSLYRSYMYYQSQGSRRPEVATNSTTASGASLLANGRLWRTADWINIVPTWVWEELKRCQRDPRQCHHSPGDIRSAGSSMPSSVHDALFSAIQVRVMNRARLHPALAPYWARAIVKMMLIPSQAVSLLVDLVEDLCLGAGHAGDVVPDILADAFDAFSDNPGLPADEAAAGSTAGSLGAVAAAPELPVFGRLSDTSLSSAAGLQSLFGGKEAMARFMSPSEGALVRK